MYVRVYPFIVTPGLFLQVADISINITYMLTKCVCVCHIHDFHLVIMHLTYMGVSVNGGTARSSIKK